MDLYEALKGGTSTDELVKSFYKDLSSAQERIKKEKEEAEKNSEKKQWVDSCRMDLADAIFDYMGAIGDLFDYDFSLKDNDYETIVKTLESFEKEMKNTISATVKLDEVLRKAGVKNNKKTFSCKINDDDKVISDFLNSLK